MSIRTQLYLYQFLTIYVNPDTTLSISVPYYQCQSGHNFICINSLLSMSIRTQLYLYQFLTINVNPDTTLFLSVPYYQYQSGHNFICINSQFKSIIQESDSRSLTKKNYSLIVIKASS